MVFDIGICPKHQRNVSMKYRLAQYAGVDWYQPWRFVVLRSHDHVCDFFSPQGSRGPVGPPGSAGKRGLIVRFILFSVLYFHHAPQGGKNIQQRQH